MTLSGHPLRRRAQVGPGRIGLAVAAAVCVLVAGLPATAQTVSVQSDPPATAVLVFVAWQELEGDLLDAPRLRQAVAGRLGEEILAQGEAVLPAADVEPLLARWRIRSGQMIHDEFLADVRAGLGADRLLVGELYLLADRLLLAWRLIGAADGRLLDAGFAEAALSLDGDAAGAAEVKPAVPRPRRTPGPIGNEPWLRAAGLLALDRTAAAAPSGPGTAPLVLPLRAIGSGEGAAALASHALLVDLVHAGEGAVADPSLVATTLRRGGWRTDQMNPTVRSLLRERFAARTAWTGQLVAYDIAATRPAPAVAEGDEPTLAGGGALEDFALSLTRIDLADGHVTVSREMFENRAVEEGWFGLQTRHPLLERLRTSVALLRRGEQD